MHPPNVADIRRLLSELLGRDVEVKPARVKLGLAGAAAVAVYTTDPPGPVGHWACDLPSAASVAAALSLTPPGVASEAVKSKVLSDALAENLGEVMNVGARLFPSDGLRVTLREVRSGTSLAALAAHTRLDVEVAVKGYPLGVMCFFVGASAP